MSWLLVGILGLGCAAGCSSTPEPVPDEPFAEQADSQGSQETLAPLGEDDRSSLVQDTKPAQEQEAEQSVPDRPVQPSVLGQEASRQIASAVRLVDSDPAGARRMLEQVVEDNPRCHQCHYNLGVLLEGEGKSSQAVRAYQRALAVHPTHLQTVVNLSNYFVRYGKLGKARSLVKAAVRAAPRSLGLRNQLVVVLLASKKLEDAANQAKGVLLVDERNVQAMILLAQAYYDWSKYELAERILLKAKDIDDTHPVIPNRLGFVYLKMDNLSAAIASFKRAVELDPNLAEAHNNLGVLYHKAHDYSAATEQLRQAVAVAPYFFEAYLNLGNALRGSRLYKEAEQAYQRALSLQPEDIRAIFNLGIMYLDDEVPGYKKSQRYKLAIAQLERYQRKGGHHPKLTGYLKEATKKHERAVKADLRQKKKEEDKRRKEEQQRKAEIQRAKEQAESAKKAIEAKKIRGGKDDEVEGVEEVGIDKKLGREKGLDERKADIAPGGTKLGGDEK